MASQPVFAQNIIAMVWDFDKTLIPGYMQAPLFAAYGVSERDFWSEVNARQADYQQQVGLVSSEIVYLNHILEYTRKDIFRNLNNARLKTLGSELGFCAGLPDYFKHIQALLHEHPDYLRHEITLEHYVVSTGLRQMILGSAIAPYVAGVWGCEFLERDARISELGYVLDNTTKTRALFEINKGANKFPEKIDVNATIAPEYRRIPFEQMIYIADGPSDVPVFSLLRKNGGNTYAVYDSGSHEQFKQVKALQDQGRVQSFGEADYSAHSQTSMWLRTVVAEIADQIVTKREATLSNSVGVAPRHINE